MDDKAIILKIQQVELQVKKGNDSVGVLSRKVADLARQVETLDQDRSILESIQGAIRSLEEASRLQSSHINTIFQSLKLEVQVQGQRTEQKMEDVKDKVEEHVGGLVDTIESKKTVLVKEGFFDGLKRNFRKVVRK